MTGVTPGQATCLVSRAHGHDRSNSQGDSASSILVTRSNAKAQVGEGSEPWASAPSEAESSRRPLTCRARCAPDGSESAGCATSTDRTCEDHLDWVRHR